MYLFQQVLKYGNDSINVEKILLVEYILKNNYIGT